MHTEKRKEKRKEHLVIATRRSPLALWQAEHVKAEIERLHEGVTVELQPMVTKGDKILDSPLAKIGGKGLFVKELEQALLDGRADIAVHSMKDVPMALPDGLCLEIICKRESPWDCLIGGEGVTSIEGLSGGTVVGTSSLRRQSQLRHYRPDLVVKDLRGNINTRLGKLDAGEYQAIILAQAGIDRMGFNDRVSETLSKAASLPAVGQGALGIECRCGDESVLERVRALNCNTTRLEVTAERAMNRALMGGCQVPIAGFAESRPVNEAVELLQMEGLVGRVDGTLIYRAEAEVSIPSDLALSERLHQAEQLGRAIADDLLAQGAEAILSALRA